MAYRRVSESKKTASTIGAFYHAGVKPRFVPTKRRLLINQQIPYRNFSTLTKKHQ